MRRLWFVPVLLLVWEAATRLMADTDFPPPSTIVATMWRLWFSGPAGQLFLTDAAVANLLPSLARMFTGWVLAAVIGVLAGVALGRSRTAESYVEPLIEFGRAIPPPLLLPLFLVLFRAGPAMQLAGIVSGVIWPVLLNSIEGARSVEPTQLDTAAVFGVPRWRVILPAATPKILAGLRLSLSLALIMMVISELFGGTDGIGYQLLQAQRGFDTPGVWAAIALLGLLGYLVNSLFVVVERRLLHRRTQPDTA